MNKIKAILNENREEDFEEKKSYIAKKIVAKPKKPQIGKRKLFLK